MPSLGDSVRPSRAIPQVGTDERHAKKAALFPSNLKVSGHLVVYLPALIFRIR